MPPAMAVNIPRVVSDSSVSLSEVLSTLQSPTIDLMMPLAVPLTAGLANGAFVSSAPCKLLAAATSRPDIVLPSDTAPSRNARPLIVVIPDKTAFIESALFSSSSTLDSTELLLDARVYTDIHITTLR